MMVISSNKFFKENFENIRLIKAIRVNSDFNARRDALMRTYIYRVCTLVSDKLETNVDDSMCFVNENEAVAALPKFCPIFELERCCFLYRSLDPQRLQEVVNILSGCHDYRNFTHPKWLDQRPYVDPFRCVDIGFERSAGFLEEKAQMGNMLRSLSVEYEYWNFIFKSKSFMFRQVRKLTNTILLYSLGAISLEQVKLQISGRPCPDFHYPKFVDKVPGHGLYLVNVQYNEEDLVFTEKTEEQT